jgi:hypothetical protein
VMASKRRNVLVRRVIIYWKQKMKGNTKVTSAAQSALTVR